MTPTGTGCKRVSSTNTCVFHSGAPIGTEVVSSETDDVRCHRDGGLGRTVQIHQLRVAEFCELGRGRGRQRFTDREHLTK